MSRWLTPFARMADSSPVGSKTRDQFIAKTDDDGNRRLVKTGEVNVYEQIQSFALDCDLKRIIERCQMTGDFTALLQRPQPLFMDCTDMPQDLMAAHAAMESAKEAYNSLTAKQKQQFEGFEGFLSQFKTAEGIKAFIDGLNPVNDEKPVEGKISASTPISESEVTSNAT